MNSTANIIETLTDGMEVIETTASTPAAAMKVGMEQAARYTARGYATECVGVIAHSGQVLVKEAAESIADDSYTAIERKGYRPVIAPAGR